jgi:hypothetical protein
VSDRATSAGLDFRPAYQDRRAVRQQLDTVEIRLSAGRLWSGNNHSRPAAVRCLQGIVWVTQENDRDDSILAAGETFVPDHRGVVVAQAMRDALIQIDNR